MELTGEQKNIGRRYAGRVLGFARRLRGLHQKEVAEALGVSTNHVAQVEAGMTSFRERRFVALCELLRVDDSVVRMLGCVSVEKLTLTKEGRAQAGQLVEALLVEGPVDRTGQDDGQRDHAEAALAPA